MSASHSRLSTLNKAARTYLRWWIGDWDPDDISTPRGLLKFLQALGPNILEGAVFLGAAWSIFGQHSCPEGLSPREWFACKQSALLPAFLAIIVGVVFHLSRISAETELTIAGRVFSESRVPKQWVSMNEPVGIALQAIVFFMAYLAIAWLAGNILVVSSLLLLVACLDWNTRRLVRDRIMVYFADDAYTPPENDSHRSSIMKYRDVVRWYLDQKPHLWKEAGKVAGTAVSCGLAIGWYSSDLSWTRSVSYLVLISTLVVNEVITLRWRLERDRRLQDIVF